MTRDKRKSYLKEVNLIHIYLYIFFCSFWFFWIDTRCTYYKHSEKFINHLLHQVSFLRDQTKGKDQQQLLNRTRSQTWWYMSYKKSSPLPANVQQAYMEQKLDQKQIPSTPPTAKPKTNLNNSDVTNISNKETYPLQPTHFKEKETSRKDSQMHQSLKNNCRKIFKTTAATVKKETIFLTRSFLITSLNQPSY